MDDEAVRALLAAVPVPTIVCRRTAGDVVVAAFNDAALRMSPTVLPHAVGRPVSAVLEHLPEAVEAIEQALRQRRTMVRERVARLAEDRADRVIRAHFVPVADDVVLVHAEDLTERTHHERLALSVVESLEDGLLVMEDGGRVLLANDRAAEILGVGLSELYGGGAWWEHFEVLADDGLVTRGVGGGAAERVMAGGDPVRDVGFRIRRRDGSLVWVSANYGPLEGTPGGLIVSFRDITERRRAVEQFERAFEDAPIGMGLMDLDGRYLRVNTAACQLVGLARSTAETMSWLDVVHPDDLRAAREALRILREGGEPPPVLEQRFVHVDGTVLDVVKTMSVVRGDGAGDGYVICHVLDVSERRRYEHELEQRALRDPLTGLPNRALFSDRLAHALGRVDRSGCAAGVAFLDLDEFKRVNDSLGHTAGDEVLTETARRLAAVMREGDTICRFGGDEFAVLCEDLDADCAEATLLEVGERLLREIARAPYAVGDETLHLHGSVGLALAAPGSAMTPDRLVAESDAAMYRAKRRGGTRPELAHDETALAASRLALETDLRAALSVGGDGLWLAYQPIVDLVSGEMAGLEALLRWDRPGHGLVSPAEVIPVAEDAGMIVELGQWVLNQAVADLASWPGPRRPYVAVNLGARQFTDDELVGQLRACLDRFGVEPASVSLEITESVAMADAERALGTMRALKDVGVRIAIDDFGTGFSSLGYLKRFPADTVKIDREFIADVAGPSEDRAIVSAVLRMAQALELDVVAEGVETEEQRSALASLGCVRAQGFLFARPSPLGEVLQLSGC